MVSEGFEPDSDLHASRTTAAKAGALTRRALACVWERGTRSRVRPTRVVRVTVNVETYERLVEVRKSLSTSCVRTWS